MILEEQRRAPFDPLTPLLPEEVCWLLDRSFACEVNICYQLHLILHPIPTLFLLYCMASRMFILCFVCCIQMEWHSGKTLSQSVFTILFVHDLPDINPEYLSPKEDEDPTRPRWLITVVVRAAMLALLKCCDLAWRELSKGRVQDVRPLP